MFCLLLTYFRPPRIPNRSRSTVCENSLSHQLLLFFFTDTLTEYGNMADRVRSGLLFSFLHIKVITVPQVICRMCKNKNEIKENAMKIVWRTAPKVRWYRDIHMKQHRVPNKSRKCLQIVNYYHWIWQCILSLICSMCWFCRIILLINGENKNCPSFRFKPVYVAVTVRSSFLHK